MGAVKFANVLEDKSAIDSFKISFSVFTMLIGCFSIRRAAKAFADVHFAPAVDKQDGQLGNTVGTASSFNRFYLEM